MGRFKFRCKSEIYYYSPILFFLIYYIVALLPEYTIGRKLKGLIILSMLLLIPLSTAISLWKLFNKKPIDYRKLIVIILPLLILLILILKITIKN